MHADTVYTCVHLQVCFLTSQLRGSGTDSTVHFELHGERGSSGLIKAAAGREAFERGTTWSDLAKNPSTFVAVDVVCL
jgi:hypothetical protein